MINRLMKIIAIKCSNLFEVKFVGNSFFGRHIEPGMHIPIEIGLNFGFWRGTLGVLTIFQHSGVSSRRETSFEL